MPLNFSLIRPEIFPDPDTAQKDGYLAWSNEIYPELILSAYLKGIFPWYSKDDPVLWWSPNPRLVLFPHEFKASKSLRLLVNKNLFDIKFDSCFKNVMEECAIISRSDQDGGTWITDEMVDNYVILHNEGYAHSVEVFQNGNLVGGLYGLALGNVFCGESMFHHVSNASKVAFYFLIKHLNEKGFRLLDAQVPTGHLKSLGAREIPRKQFLTILEENINLKSNW